MIGQVADAQFLDRMTGDKMSFIEGLCLASWLYLSTEDEARRVVCESVLRAMQDQSSIYYKNAIAGLGHMQKLLEEATGVAKVVNDQNSFLDGFWGFVAALESLA